MDTSRPLVGISCCRKQIPPHWYHAVGEKYITAIIDGADAVPFLVPSMASALPMDAILENLDGIMFTGSHSNVEPHHYEDAGKGPGVPPHDPHRDATTLPLIPAAVRGGVPVLAICRGCQETNVAYGGSLHQKVHEVEGLLDHRDPDAADMDINYGPAHEVELVKGGLLERLAGCDRVRVNSLHGQGIKRLGRGLVVEATAPDGLVEAFRVADAQSFALAVQWHPEYKVLENPFAHALFEAFGAACRERAQRRRRNA